MGIYWLSSALPIAVTALLPLILFPAMGLMSAKVVARNYMTVTTSNHTLNKLHNGNDAKSHAEEIT